MKLLNSMFIYPFMISGLSFGLSVSAIAADYITEESTEQLEDNYTQQQLAKLYLENLDLPEDSRKPYEWFAIRGYAPAQFMLGVQAYDPVNKIKWYQIAADNGHTSAIANLAYIYYAGKYGVPQDYTKAFKLYKKLADTDDMQAQYQLAEMYYHGAGTPQSYSQAFTYYQKAADNKKMEAKYTKMYAEYSLGLMYYGGLGVAQDYEKAFDIFENLVAQGNTNAEYNLGVMYDRGLGVIQNKMKAKEWFEIAASRESYTGLGKTHAEYRLGKMYFEGIDVVQDYDAALSWFKKAASNSYFLGRGEMSKGHLLTQYQLGDMYYDGIGVTQDYTQAFKWYVVVKYF